MGNDNLYKRRSSERKRRKENQLKLKSSTWLIVCEGKETEPNYFKSAIEEVNKNIEDKYKLKVKIVGKGMNTKSLINATDLQIRIDSLINNLIPYGKVFVVFDKDSFKNADFDNAIKMCESNNYIPLWSNQAIEFWFLLHFNYIYCKIDRKDYAKKLNIYFKNNGLDYKYKKNDKDIYNLLCTYGSLSKAREYACKISDIQKYKTPSSSESCTYVFKFFDEIDNRIDELK